MGYHLHSLLRHNWQNLMFSKPFFSSVVCYPSTFRPPIRYSNRGRARYVTQVLCHHVDRRHGWVDRRLRKRFRVKLEKLLSLDTNKRHVEGARKICQSYTELGPRPWLHWLGTVDTTTPSHDILKQRWHCMTSECLLQKPIWIIVYKET